MFSKHPTVSTIALAVAAGLVVQAHPHVEPSRSQLQIRDLKMRSCAPQIAAFNQARKAKRALGRGMGPLERRTLDNVVNPAGATATALGNWAPAFDSLQNTTCFTTPEIEEGPFYTNGEFLRQDIRDGQQGVELLLDIGLIDLSTCQPLSGALVDIWHANSTGSYAGYSDFTGGPQERRNADEELERRQGGGGGGGHASTINEETQLRGLWVSNSDGLVEFKSIFPGFYTGRTIHVHMIIRTDYTLMPNGTLAVGSGTARHIGQFFFDDSLADEILATSPYTTNTHSRIKNSEDRLVSQSIAAGYNGVSEYLLLGANATDGVLTYITVGVDLSKEYAVGSNQYLKSPTASNYILPATTGASGGSTGQGTVSTPAKSSGSGSSSGTTSAAQAAASTGNSGSVIRAGGPTGLVASTIAIILGFMS